MAAKRYGTDAKAERPEFPKPVVRLTPAAGGYGCEVLMVSDGDAEAGAKDQGFAALPIPPLPPGFQEYPKWLYHADGRRQIVGSPAEAETLEGFEEIPVSPEPPAAARA